MFKNRSVLTIAAVGAIFIFLTAIAFFLLDIEKNKLYWNAFWFLIVAELIFSVGLICLLRFRPSLFVRVGLTATLGLYLVAALIASLCAGKFETVNGYILLHIAIIGVFAVLAVLLVNFAGRMGSSDRGTVANRALMQEYEKRAQELAGNPIFTAYSPRLRQLQETLKYADYMGSNPAGTLIGDRFTALENALREGAEENIVQEIIDNLQASLSHRNAEASASKRRGF